MACNELPSPTGVFLFFMDSIRDVYVTLVIGKLPSPFGVFILFMIIKKIIMKSFLTGYRPLLGFFFFSWNKMKKVMNILVSLELPSPIGVFLFFIYFKSKRSTRS